MAGPGAAAAAWFPLLLACQMMQPRGNNVRKPRKVRHSVQQRQSSSKSRPLSGVAPEVVPEVAPAVAVVPAAALVPSAALVPLWCPLWRLLWKWPLRRWRRCLMIQILLTALQKLAAVNCMISYSGLPCQGQYNTSFFFNHGVIFLLTCCNYVPGQVLVLFGAAASDSL